MQGTLARRPPASASRSRLPGGGRVCSLLRLTTSLTLWFLTSAAGTLRPGKLCGGGGALVAGLPEGVSYLPSDATLPVRPGAGRHWRCT